jgi:DNA-binding NtrC family response regulator
LARRAHFEDSSRVEIDGVEPAALAGLTSHPWSGNIRELENVVERLFLFCDGVELKLSDLPAETTDELEH